MRTNRLLLLGGVLATSAAAPLVAHHAFGAEFDRDAPIRLQGVIVKLEWVNPHSWIHMEVANEQGETEVWMVEGGTPNVLLRRGLRRDCLTPGTEIIVSGRLWIPRCTPDWWVRRRSCCGSRWRRRGGGSGIHLE